MEFDNSFEVPLPVDDAWKVLMDIRRIAPCMPGAELTEVIDDRTYKGKIGVRLGPVALAFAGTVKFDEIDDAAHTARVAAQGSDAKGRGAANATASFHLEPAGGGKVRQVIGLRRGLDDELARRISKLVRDEFPRVRAQIQGDAVRVSGKSKDDLQKVIARLRVVSEDYPVPLQYVNYR